MQYNIHCTFSIENLLNLKLLGYDPNPSIHEGCIYIDSYLEEEHMKIALYNLQKIKGVYVTEKNITAKELDYLYTLRNIQYRIGRFTREIKTIIKWL